MFFIKIFQNFDAALAFSQGKKTQITVRYDWDSLLNCMIKEYIVRY